MINLCFDNTFIKFFKMSEHFTLEQIPIPGGDSMNHFMVPYNPESVILNYKYLQLRSWFAGTTDHAKERRDRVFNIYSAGFEKSIDVIAGDFDKMLFKIETEQMGYDKRYYQDYRPISLTFIDSLSLVSKLNNMEILLDKPFFAGESQESWERRMRVRNIVNHGIGSEICFDNDFDKMLKNIEVGFMNYDVRAYNKKNRPKMLKNT